MSYLVLSDFVSLAFSGCFKKDISQLRHQSNRGSWCYGTRWTTSTGFISHILISTRKLCVSIDKYSSWNMYITVTNVSEYLNENISNQWICMYKLLSIFMYIIQYHLYVKYKHFSTSLFAVIEQSTHPCTFHFIKPHVWI